MIDVALAVKPSLTITVDDPRDAQYLLHALAGVPGHTKVILEGPSPAVERLEASLRDFVGLSDRLSENLSDERPIDDAGRRWMSTTAAARRLGCSPRQVLRRLSDGRLSGFQPSGERGSWMVDERSIERFERNAA